MLKADSFIQPMQFSGTPNTPTWAGYDYLQNTGDTFHPGLDYNYGSGEADKGLPVLCIGNGFVEKCISWDGKTKGFGNHAFIKHELPDGTVVYSHYCHLDSITCKEGQEIKIGDEVGKCGGSGGWPSHLHLEIRLPIGKGYDFWPKGMSKEWVGANYYDPYGFIEKRRGTNVDQETFGNLVAKSTRWDDLVKFIDENKDPLNTTIDDIKSYISGIKSRWTDLENQLKDKEKKLALAEKEIENRIDQLANNETDCQNQKKLQKAEYDKLFSDYKTLEKLQESYVGTINDLRGQLREVQKQGGIKDLTITELKKENELLKNGVIKSNKNKELLNKIIDFIKNLKK